MKASHYPVSREGRAHEEPDLRYPYAEIQHGRRAGVLLPIFSLPSRGGIGTLGREAFRFIDFLAEAGFSCWQILPIGPTGYGDSPYQSLSSCAGNPYFIDPEILFDEGLVTEDELHQLVREGDLPERRRRVDYALLWETRPALLKRAWARFDNGCTGKRYSREDFAAFCQSEAEWLLPYAAFAASKEQYGHASVESWPLPRRRFDSPEVQRFCREQEASLLPHMFSQYLFFEQWEALHQYAGLRGIDIIGDLPIYAASDSCERFLYPESLMLDEEGLPTLIGGCPPDDFSQGQVWGNPLYDWDHEEACGFPLTLSRFTRQFKLFDQLRVDHFKGLDACWAIPFKSGLAKDGRWLKVPGEALLSRLFELCPKAVIAAEDLGYKTPSVAALRERFSLPGMKVIQCGLSPYGNSEKLPHNTAEHCFYYFGTHDNLPVKGWLAEAAAEERRFAVRYFGLSEAEGFDRGLLRGLWSSRAQTVIAQAQDLLGTGSESRMNDPGCPGAWQWRVSGEGSCAFTPALAAEFYELSKRYARLPEKAENSQ